MSKVRNAEYCTCGIQSHMVRKALWQNHARVRSLKASGLQATHEGMICRNARLVPWVIGYHVHDQSETSACSSCFSVLPGKLLRGKLLRGKVLRGKLLPAEYTVWACLLVIHNFSCYELVRNFIALNGN